MSKDKFKALVKELRLTQQQRVIAWLQEFGTLTHFEAFEELGIVDLPKRVSELINDYGFRINKEAVNCNNRFGESTSYKRYSMEVQHGGICQTL